MNDSIQLVIRNSEYCNRKSTQDKQMFVVINDLQYPKPNHPPAPFVPPHTASCPIVQTRTNYLFRSFIELLHFYDIEIITFVPEEINKT